MRDVLISGVKSAVQFAVAAFVSWLTTVGIDIAGEAAIALETGVFAVVFGVLVSALNWLGQKFPVVNRIVSLGLSSGTATY